MARDGFGNVTVEQVAAAAQVSPSTVYRYFGTKEALVLWGDRAGSLLDVFSAKKIGKKRTIHQAFVESATEVFSGADVIHQLGLVFAYEELTTAFEHEVLSQRAELADLIAAHRGSKSPGGRDHAVAGAMLGALIAVLERWQATNGKQSISKQLPKAFEPI